MCALFPMSFTFKCLLLSYQKAVNLFGFGDMYGFSKCSSWKPPISEVDHDIFHYRAFSSRIIFLFRKIFHIILQIMTTKYWRQSCQADVFILLLELYLGWVSTLMRTGMDDSGLKRSQLYQRLYKYFHLIMSPLHNCYLIFLEDYTRRAKIDVPVYGQHFLIYIALGENKVI